MTAATPYHSDDTAFAVQAPQVIERLRVLLPERALVIEEAERRAYESDGLSAFRQLPLVVAIPDTIEQVQAVLATCHELGVPVVARGSGTSLSGGAMPHPQGVLLSMARFNQVLELDPERRMARVQPGVRNLAISEAAAPHGLYYAPDPSSQIACSIGGNIAENAGGVHCLKYGLTVHNVLEVTLATIEGDVITVGSQALDTPGYDLLALMHGSEGMLGVILEATVRLLPEPLTKQVLLAAFDSAATAGNAVAGLIAAGIVPAGLEMMDGPAIKAAEDFVHAGYPTDAAAILICELDGGTEEVVADTERVDALLRESGATEVRVARDADERARFWAGRKAAFPAAGRISPDYYCMDGTIPRKHLGDVLTRIADMGREHGLGVVNVFHAGDGNLHPLILYDGNTPGELEQAEAFGARILELCVEKGGTITGEHGVGVEKINEMCIQFSDTERETFFAIKRAFDPPGLLNPGKAIPTLNRCAEFGAMHVHHGEVAHPELERY
ncbi:FAD-linked oxidase C-terminal domain-containing protein [Halofilum ochraceum]|uniref:FAD-linked oxidase C-terminal domain-containing protein n=1 Tax=Halofilum ochraceum TaxID=1611323 RepID=UPI0008DB06BD|nr:FAD-linked oxidase C-terminal domain-containing protein [Halofilum ochraceum]